MELNLNKVPVKELDIEEKTIADKMQRISGLIDWKEGIRRFVKYLIEGLAVAIAAMLLPNRKFSTTELLILAGTAASMFIILDLFAPTIGVMARTGAGFGLGAHQVGFML